jgi:4-hydroxy-3-methylbut-2-en-1-yl diphosphate reductase
MGEAPGQMHLVGSVEEVDQLQLPADSRIAYLTQTTLSLDDTRDIIERLRQRFPQIEGPNVDDICYATQNRQNAVQQIALQAPVILVIGSFNSSNSNRLAEVAEKSGARAYLINDVAKIDPAWLENVSSIGITAGASTPEFLIERVVAHLRDFGFDDVSEVQTVEENVHFALPSELEKSL